MDKLTLADLEKRLYAWGAWARLGQGGQGRCGSAEGRYLPPRDDDGQRDRRLAYDPINVADAELIDACVASLRNTSDRVLVVAFYQSRETDLQIAKRLDIKPFMVEARRWIALGALQRVLDDKLYQKVMDRRVKALLHSGAGSNKYESPLMKAAPAP